MNPRTLTTISCVAGVTGLLTAAALVGIWASEHPRSSLGYLLVGLIVILLGMTSAATWVVARVESLAQEHQDCVGGIRRHADDLEHLADAVRSVTPNRGGLRRVS